MTDIPLAVMIVALVAIVVSVIVLYVMHQHTAQAISTAVAVTPQSTNAVHSLTNAVTGMESRLKGHIDAGWKTAVNEFRKKPIPVLTDVVIPATDPAAPAATVVAGYPPVPAAVPVVSGPSAGGGGTVQDKIAAIDAESAKLVAKKQAIVSKQAELNALLSN